VLDDEDDGDEDDEERDGDEDDRAADEEEEEEEEAAAAAAGQGGFGRGLQDGRRGGLDEVENAVGVQQVGEQAVIFKVFDDCRQDALALQVIKLLDWSFQRLGIGLFLKPYEVLPSRVGREAAEGGMLEVVPDVISLDEMGRGLGIPSIYHLFRTRYGRPDEARFEKARWNLQRSLAAYAVACYTLWIKDRHDGNIMVDGQGHLVHIDFGFLLGISPGGNLGFETAAFKITPQMINVLGGSADAEPYLRFLEMSARAFMQARQQRALLEALVCTTADSGLPCFHFGHTLREFRARLRPEVDADGAVAHWRSRVRDARSTSTTALYDGIQRMQNGIHSEAFQ
jgi:phosphatidylinositol 4-kinase